MTPETTASGHRGWPPGAIPSTVSDHVCLDFVNSRFTDHTGSGEVYDRLTLVAWQRWFVERCGLEPTPPPGRAVHQELVAMRTLLRRLLESAQPPPAGDVTRLNAFLSRAGQWREALVRGSELCFRVRWSDPGWPAVITSVASSYAALLEENGARRVRVCANPGCSYLFFDASRNASRHWCDVTICGNLVKVRRHRARITT